MRSIFYIDPSISQDQTYVEYLKEEIPKRLRLLEAEYSASPWTVTFADDEYGDSDLEGFTQNLSRYHDSADAVIILPDPNKIESDYGLESSKVLKSGYMRQIQTLVSQASSHGLPVLAYLEEPGPRAEFNLITSGISSVVDHVADPRHGERSHAATHGLPGCHAARTGYAIVGGSGAGFHRHLAIRIARSGAGTFSRFGSILSRLRNV